MPKIITIGREFGSGGRDVAQKLAGRLGIPFYDKKIIEIAAIETGLSENFIREAEHQTTSGFAYSVFFSGNNLPIYDQVFIAESKIVKRAAAKSPCVIVGRCSNYVLRDTPNCLHVFLYAPFESRVRRAIAEYGVNEAEAKSVVTKNDKARSAYYRHFTTEKWGRSQNYDISINSDIGIDVVVDIIAGAATSSDKGGSE